MDPIEEPPDPQQARILLADYLGKVSAGEKVNGELTKYGERVIGHLREKIADLRNYGGHARALDEFSNRCYKGAGSAKELERMLQDLSKELSEPINPRRAEILKKGIESINFILS